LTSFHHAKGHRRNPLRPALFAFLLVLVEGGLEIYISALAGIRLDI